MNNLLQDINFTYFLKIDKIYNSFENKIKDFQNIIYLIYEIYYEKDQFKIINENIKQSFKSTLKLLIFNNNLYLQPEENFDFTNKQSYINLIINLINCNFHDSLTAYLEQIINYLNKNKIKKYDKCIYNEIYIQNWFKQKNIDLNNNIITIQNTKIPNFIKLNKIYNIIDLNFEFYHLLFKIYKPVIERNFCFYEANQYHISKNDIVFDCGANMGLFAAYAASKGAKVYCFEPMSYIRNYLIEIQKLYPDNIIIIPYAVGIREEYKNFMQFKNPGESKINDYSINSFKFLYNERVKIIKLDDFIQKNDIFPTFIKMDIEGSELFALKGCYNYLKNNKIILSISLDHNQNDKQLISNFINSLNLNYNMFYFNKGESINNSLFMLCK